MHMSEMAFLPERATVIQNAQFLQIAPAALASISVVPLAPAAQSLPVANTQSGNVFTDRVNAALAWYLPSFTLAADVDAAFTFAAARAGVDSAGNPFDQASLTVGVAKVVPDDVRAYQAANPAIELREIPLATLSATLTTAANDPQTGQPASNTYPGTLINAADGSLSIAFNSILGVGVVIAYENLQSGGCTIAVSAAYDVWREVRRPWPIFWSHPIEERPLGLLRPDTIAAQPMWTNYLRNDTNSDPSNGSDEPATRFVQGVAAFSSILTFDKKYAAAGYATKLTVSDGTTTHAIVSVDDLKNFNSRQSEFSEFTALGDISQRYPSFSRLYIGALSRTIIAIPAAYGIVRGTSGTAAVCQALLDSSAGTTTSCKFDFTFVLGAVFSPIELLQLSQEIAANSSAHDCTVALPTQLDPRVPSTIATSFQSSVAYLAGATPHTFSLTVSIADGGSAGTPAVANANVFIKQLSAGIEPYLVGRLALRLDDFYEEPVTAAVVLNFSRTSGSDELACSSDQATGAIVLTNNSALDLTLTRYASVVNGQLTVNTLGLPLLAKASTTLAGASGGAATTVLVDRTLTLETPLTRTATSRYLTFAVQDVQNVQYQLAVVASGVDFNGRGISAITVTIVLPDLPAINVPLLTLTALDQSVNTQIQLPLEYALDSLNSTIAFGIQPLNTRQSALQFTVNNDFIDRPVFVLADSQLPALAAPP